MAKSAVFTRKTGSKIPALRDVIVTDQQDLFLLCKETKATSVRSHKHAQTLLHKLGSKHHSFLDA